MTHLGHNQQQYLSGLHQSGRSAIYKHWLNWVATNNSPFQDYTNPDDPPATNIDSPWSQPTAAPFRTTPARTNNRIQTLIYLGHNQIQSFSGLHQPGRSANCKHWLTLVTTNNSPSQDCTNPEDQPSINIDSPVSQPTTVLTTTPTRTISQLQTLTHLSHNQQRSSRLHQPGRSANYKHWLTCVTTNNSPCQDYTNTDDKLTTNIDSPGSQPTTALLRTTPTRTFSQLQTSIHLGHNQQQSFSKLHQPGRSTNNSPHDYTNPADQPATNIDSPGSQPTTILLRTTPTRTISHLQTLTQLGRNQQQPFSRLHHSGRSTSYKHWLTLVTTNSSPFQNYTNPDEQPNTNIDLPGSQLNTVLLRTTPTQTISQLQTLTHLGHIEQQSFSGLHQPGGSAYYKHWLTWVTTKSSPHDYTNLDDQPTTNIDSPGSQPTTVLTTTPSWMISQL